MNKITKTFQTSRIHHILSTKFIHSYLSSNLLLIKFTFIKYQYRKGGLKFTLICDKSRYCRWILIWWQMWVDFSELYFINFSKCPKKLIIVKIILKEQKVFGKILN